jgi:hypothetical protein
MSEPLYPVMLCVRVPQPLYDALTKACHLERRTLSQLVRILLEDAVRILLEDAINERKKETDR